MSVKTYGCRSCAEKDAKLADAHAKIDNLNHRLQTSNNENEKLRTRIRNQRQHSADIQEKLADRDKALAKANEEIEKLNSDCIQYIGRLVDKGEEIERLADDFNYAHEGKRKLEKKLEAHNAFVAADDLVEEIEEKLNRNEGSAAEYIDACAAKRTARQAIDKPALEDK